MLLTKAILSNFRNYAQLQIEPAPGLNVFVGVNAQGKSNLLEAIAMLGTGKSFRMAHDGDAVRFHSDAAAVRGEVRVAAGTIVLACAITKSAAGTRKTYTVNGRGVRYSSFLGKLRVVAFVPADLQLANGPPSLRRAFINIALAQEDPLYYRELTRYRKTVAQKNALLREATAPDSNLLAAYDEALVSSGAYVMVSRARWIAALAEAARDAHAGFCNGTEHLEVEYKPNVPVALWNAADVIAAFEAQLMACAQRERARRAAIAGPHGDDLELRLNGRSLAAFGSQGQRRTAVLALKTAEYAVAREHAGEAPLLLLDDVLSELDEARAAAFLAGVGDYDQAFITTTHAPAALPRSARLYTIQQGVARIEEPACSGA